MILKIKYLYDVLENMISACIINLNAVCNCEPNILDTDCLFICCFAVFMYIITVNTIIT
jgi:hypothetical protein